MRKETARRQPLPLWARILLILVAVVSIFFLRRYIYAIEAEKQQAARDGKEYARQVPDDNEAFLYFQEQVPGREIFLACEEDLTDDGRKDLVVIYHNPEEGRINWMVALINRGDGTYDITHPTRAPIENQAIRFFNMDKEGELEFVLTGEKDGEVGYAIYRVIDGELIDLFGEDMEDCC